MVVESENRPAYPWRYLRVKSGYCSHQAKNANWSRVRHAGGMQIAPFYATASVGALVVCHWQTAPEPAGETTVRFLLLFLWENGTIKNREKPDVYKTREG